MGNNIPIWIISYGSDGVKITSEKKNLFCNFIVTL